MIIDYRYNKTKRELSVSYTRDDGMKGIEKFNVDRFKAYASNPHGEFINWDGTRCQRKYNNAPKKFDIKTYIEELDSKTKKLFEGRTAPKLFTWDIEVVSDEFPKPEEAKYPIVTISVCDPNCNVIIMGTKDLGEDGDAYLSNNFKKYIDKLEYFKTTGLKMPAIKYMKFDRESDMIEYFLSKFVAYCPVLAGWNSMLFDWQYIVNRVKNYYPNINLGMSSANYCLEHKSFTDLAGNKIVLPIPNHTIMVDMMDIVGNYDFVVMPIKESLTLDYIAEEMLGVNKIQYESTLYDLYFDDYQKYVFYNAIDSVLVQLIDKRFKTMQNFYTQALYCREKIGSTFSKIAVSEALVFNYFYDNGIKVVVPEEMPEIERGVLMGAYVRTPTPGKHNFVCCNDFASLYPSSIITCNLSFENYLGDGYTDDELDEFRKDPNYFVSTIGHVYRNDKDYAFKVIQATLKGNRNIFKYLAKGLDADVLSDVEKILDGKDVTNKTYSHDKVNAIAEMGYNVNCTNDLIDLLNNKGVKYLSEFARKLKTTIEFYTSYEQAMKLLGNSMYGGSSHQSFFWYNMGLANDITGEARNIIHLMENHIPKYIREEWPYMKNVHESLGIVVKPEHAETVLRESGKDSFVEVVYGDTDSLYISYENLVKTIDGWENMSVAERGRVVVEFNTKYLDAHNRDVMDEHYTERHVKSVQNFELETLALSGVWLDVKKRYAQVLLWKDGKTFNVKDGLPMKAKGLEMIKSAYPKQAREGLKRLVRYLLEDDGGEQYLIYRLNCEMQREKRDFFNADIDDICGSVKVNNYKNYIISDDNRHQLVFKNGCPFNVKAVGNYNRLRKAYNLPGDPIYGGKVKWYVYYPMGTVKKDNFEYFAYQAKNYPKWADKYAPIAKDVMFQKQMLDPFNRIIEAIGLGTLKLDGSIDNLLF